MTRHPPHLGIAPGDALFTIPAADRALLRTALEDRIASLRTEAERIRAKGQPLSDFIAPLGGWKKDPPDPAQPVLDEAREVGRLLDVLGEER
jgi:hypothetical protein